MDTVAASPRRDLYLIFAEPALVRHFSGWKGSPVRIPPLAPNFSRQGMYGPRVQRRCLAIALDLSVVLGP
jgi:hypothetical protein